VRRNIKDRGNKNPFADGAFNYGIRKRAFFISENQKRIVVVESAFVFFAAQFAFKPPEHF